MDANTNSLVVADDKAIWFRIPVNTRIASSVLSRFMSQGLTVHACKDPMNDMFPTCVRIPNKDGMNYRNAPLLADAIIELVNQHDIDYLANYLRMTVEIPFLLHDLRLMCVGSRTVKRTLPSYVYDYVHYKLYTNTLDTTFYKAFHYAGFYLGPQRRDMMFTAVKLNRYAPNNKILVNFRFKPRYMRYVKRLTAEINHSARIFDNFDDPWARAHASECLDMRRTLETTLLRPSNQMFAARFAQLMVCAADAERYFD